MRYAAKEKVAKDLEHVRRELNKSLAGLAEKNGKANAELQGTMTDLETQMGRSRLIYAKFED